MNWSSPRWHSDEFDLHPGGIQLNYSPANCQGVPQGNKGAAGEPEKIQDIIIILTIDFQLANLQDYILQLTDIWDKIFTQPIFWDHSSPQQEH